MLCFNEDEIDIDIDALVMRSEHEGIAILPWGSRIPRVGESFEYDDGDGRFVLEAVKYHPRSPTAAMRRRYCRPDYWLTVRLLAVSQLFRNEMRVGI